MTYVRNRNTCPAFSKLRDSKEKLEKVVNPPQTPILMKLTRFFFELIFAGKKNMRPIKNELQDVYKKCSVWENSIF